MYYYYILPATLIAGLTARKVLKVILWKLYWSICVRGAQVIEQSLGLEQTRPLPPCPVILPSTPAPLNTSSKR